MTTPDNSLSDDDLDPEAWISLCARRAFDARQSAAQWPVGSPQRLDALLGGVLDALLGAAEQLTKIHDRLDEWDDEGLSTSRAAPPSPLE